MSLMHRVKQVVDVKQAEAHFKEGIEKTPLEKNDVLAMIIAAFIVFLPGLLLVLGVFYSVFYLFFLR